MERSAACSGVIVGEEVAEWVSRPRCKFLLVGPVRDQLDLCLLASTMLPKQVMQLKGCKKDVSLTNTATADDYLCTFMRTGAQGKQSEIGDGMGVCRRTCPPTPIPPVVARSMPFGWWCSKVLPPLPPPPPTHPPHPRTSFLRLQNRCSSLGGGGGGGLLRGRESNSRILVATLPYWQPCSWWCHSTAVQNWQSSTLLVRLECAIQIRTLTCYHRGRMVVDFSFE